VNQMTESVENLNLTKESFPLERYVPLSLLGRGGLGEVYLADDRLLNRTIAVKCLMAVDDEQFVIFQREAKIASKLNHPNIIATLDFGITEGGRPYIAFEYFDGISLEQLLVNNDGVLDEQLTRNIFSVVADALSYIHQHKVFHRDLKPSNILIRIDPSGAIDLRIIDFGVSAIREEFQNRDLAQGKTIVGTPVYMSPDPVRGKAFDARSEIYAIGCILFECLTGDPPFDSSSTAEVLELHMHEEPPPLEDMRSDLQFSPEIQDIISKCLSKSKDERYQSMSELKAALERPYAHNSSVQDGAPPVEAPKKPASVNLLGVLGVFALLVMGALAINAILFNSTQKDAADLALEKQNSLSKKSNGSLSFEAHDSVYLEREPHKNATGVYFSGADSSKRLQSIADAGQSKELVAFNNVTVSEKDVENIAIVKPEVLQFFGCKIAPDVIGKISTIDSIRELNFHVCPNITPPVLATLKRMRNLVSLRLIGCGIDDNHMKVIGEFGKLQRLVLDGNKNVTMRGLLQLKRSGAIIVVWLNEGPLTNLSVREVATLKAKHHIYLWNKLTRYEGDGGDGMNNPDALELVE
jgi:serine/threonine protein kinase